MSHFTPKRNQGKRGEQNNKARGGRGGAESPIGDPFALSKERLASLDLEGGLNQRRDYSESCHELALLLRLCYSLSPKPVQAHLFALVQQAITNLPCMDGALHRSAARQLMQACQAALPRHRKQAVTSEYKRLCVMLARAEKKTSNAEEDSQTDSPLATTGEALSSLSLNEFSSDEYSLEASPRLFPASFGTVPPSIPPLPPLPSDIVHLLFFHLETPSLARASAVCSLWRDIAASAEPAWCAHLAACFGSVPDAEARESNDGKGRSGEEGRGRQESLWKELISHCKTAVPLSSIQSSRVLCRECSTVAWIPNSAPTPPSHLPAASSSLGRPSAPPLISAAVGPSSHFSRGKNKGRAGNMFEGRKANGLLDSSLAGGAVAGTSKLYHVGRDAVGQRSLGSSSSSGGSVSGGGGGGSSISYGSSGNGSGSGSSSSSCGSSGNGSGSGSSSGAARFFGRTCRVKSTTRRGYRLQQHVWRLAGTSMVVASLSDDFEGGEEDSSDDDDMKCGFWNRQS
ncbi:hypothetical protein CLOM_g15174 [Closterium sp. NIES-68]|nr:hypothetical protein CLOM_g15174 [Closterium sp. NIES-68]GJP73032.1 hypothetical protein CLOP_g3789 [Closterium sp. NIES-67]GJP82363.1 hypothetical protein CLOP_g12609 [Closterium sp. NIES-67]